MTEKIQESISAFIDDEVSEIELHRLLRQFSNGNAEQSLIKESWISYQQIRTVTSGEPSISAADHLALHKQISVAIAKETIELKASKQTSRSWMMPATGFAVAASLVIAVSIGMDVGQKQRTDVVSTDVISADVVKSAEVIDAQTVSTASNSNSANNIAASGNIETNAIAFDNSGDELELRALDAEKQNRLRDYLNRHERMTRNNPLARTVVYPTKPSDN
ncbi:MAG: hypothetical protein JKY88_12905 [Pseudomonadales bacterium]|nr:hypothetical protein [Pseudomonadales bacterium]